MVRTLAEAGQKRCASHAGEQAKNSGHRLAGMTPPHSRKTQTCLHRWRTDAGRRHERIFLPADHHELIGALRPIAERLRDRQAGRSALRSGGLRKIICGLDIPATEFAAAAHAVDQVIGGMHSGHGRE